MAQKCIQFHDEDGKPLYRITMDDSNSRLASGQAEEHYDRSGKYLGIKLCKNSPSNGKGVVSKSIDSTACLTASDSENNAMGSVDSFLDPVSDGVPIGRRRYGLDRKGNADPDRLGNYVDRAMSKVEAWPFVGDEKAVRVSVRVP